MTIIENSQCSLFVLVHMWKEISMSSYTILYIKATVVCVCLLSEQCLENSSRHCPFPVVCFVKGGGPGKLRNFLIWEFRSLWQLLPNWQFQGPKPRWPESSIKDLNRDSQYPVQTSRWTWNEVPKKKTHRVGPETRSSERKLNYFSGALT